MAQRSDAPTPETALRKLIRSNPHANGVAFIVANENGMDPNQEPLQGVIHDYTLMMDTFRQLKFAVFPLFNHPKESVLSLLQETARFRNYPQSYRRIVLTFSGHGAEQHICTHTGNISVMQDIIAMFEPYNAPHIRDIHKLFFIDACRGNKQMQPVIVPRGATDVTKIAAPYGNFLLAFSTLAGFRAYEVKAVGSLWMSLLSEKLLTSRTSVSAVLEQVNEELEKSYKPSTIQQPICTSTLVGSVCLLEEAEKTGEVHPTDWKGLLEASPAPNHRNSPLDGHLLLGGGTRGTDNLQKAQSLDNGYPANSVQKRRMVMSKSLSVSQPAADDSSQATSGHRVLENETASPDHSPSSDYHQKLAQLKREGYIKSFSFHRLEDFTTSGRPQQSFSVVLNLLDGASLSCDPASSHDPNLARTNAAQNAVLFIEREVLHCHTPPSTRPQENPRNLCSNKEVAVAKAQQEKQRAPTGSPLNHRQQLNEWFQTHRISNSNYQKTFTEGPPFQCSFTYSVNGQKRRFVSSDHHMNKKKAEEDAAERALAHERLVEAFVSDKPPKKILQEWCSKKHIANPSFQTLVVSEQMFQSTVTVDVDEKRFQGCISSPKSAAENSASLKALYSLGVICPIS